MTEQEPEILSVEEMLAADDTKYVNVPTWGGKFTRVGSLTAEEMLRWSEESETDPEMKRTAGLRLMVRCLVDKDNKRIGTLAHVEAFKKKGNIHIEHIIKQCLIINGMKAPDPGDPLSVIMSAAKG